VADLNLDKQILQDVLSKKVLRPTRKRILVRYLQEGYWTSERRVCSVAQIQRSIHRCQGRDDVWAALRMRIREIDGYGYKRIHVLLRLRDGRLTARRYVSFTAMRGFTCGGRGPNGG
jgi:putative transposase